MPKKKPRQTSKRASLAPQRLTVKRGRPLLERSDIRTILYEVANQLAPADVVTLLAHERDLRKRAAGLGVADVHALGAQLSLALDCLRDHVDGACPQIPYYTISLLAAAVSYFARELDVIPDFLPQVGRLDDAVVMALAFQLGRQGLRRYCDWKGRDLDAVLESATVVAPS